MSSEDRQIIDGFDDALPSSTSADRGYSISPTSNGTADDSSDGVDNGGGLLINIIIFYYPPLIVILGTVGNFLSLAVFRSTKLRQLSTSCYLTALSLSDTGCLLPYFATWLEILGVSVYNRPICCQMFTYLFYVCGFMSPWFVVAFTVERFVATCYPLRRAAICTVSRAQAIVLALVFIAIISYLYILFVTEIHESSAECGLKEDHLDVMNVLNFLDTIATLIVPGVLISGLNVLIARAVLRIEKVRCNMLSTTTTIMSNERSMASSDDDDEYSAGDDGGKLSNSSSTIAARRSGTGRNHFVSDVQCRRRNTRPSSGTRSCYQMKITKMLLLISTVFVVLNAPSYLVRLWVYFARSRSDSDDVVLYNLQQWSQLLFHLNFAINFLLYCVSGQNFRRSLKALFWRLLGRFDYGSNRRIARHMSFNSSKRTMTMVNNSIQANTTNAHPTTTSLTKTMRQLSDETTVVVVDSV